MVLNFGVVGVIIKHLGIGIICLVYVVVYNSIPFYAFSNGARHDINLKLNFRASFNALQEALSAGGVTT